MLGYLLSSNTLKNNAILPNSLAPSSSLERIHIDSGESLEDLVRGPNSIGAFLQNANYDSVPSPTNKDPTGGDYYSGGYNTKRYGNVFLCYKVITNLKKGNGYIRSNQI